MHGLYILLSRLFFLIILPCCVIKGKNPIFKWNIFIIILVMILSEILIFPYSIGALINYFKHYKLIEKLDELMIENNFIKVGDDV